MFKSIKTKLIAITLGIFAIFSLIILSIEIDEHKQFKETQIASSKNTIDKSAKMLEFTINQLESNVRALALSAASFYYYNKGNKDVIDFITRDNFANGQLNAVGGGIWFEPYVIDKTVERYCSYASWQDNGKVENDYNCASDEYNYLKKHWYNVVKDNYTVEGRNNVTWAKPYYDEIGTHQLMVTVGAPIYDEKSRFVGMVGEDWLLSSVRSTLASLSPTDNSIIVFADKKNDFIIAMLSSDNEVAESYVGKPLSALPWYNENLKDGQTLTHASKKYVVHTKDFAGGMCLIVKVPEDELYSLQKNSIIFETFLPFISALILTILIYLLLTKNINKPIAIFMDATKEIGHGNFDKKITIKKPTEFAQLADTFNKMTSDIQEYMENIQNLTTEKLQMMSDLNIAKEIQASSLPNVFPPFPDRYELDLYATMKPAKEVGGDFYDFYFIDSVHVVFTVADVSGKGVPAALFMMRAKSVLKSTALSNSVIATVMEKVNSTIVANNEQNFFVTIGLGVIDISTGEIIYINAGHNPPVLKRGNQAEYLQVPTNIVAGIFEDVTFEAVKLKLNPLDTLFLYTDGVTEANNSSGELYGEERLLQVLSTDVTNPKTLLNMVDYSVSEFVGEVEQADDMTMLALTYLGVDNFIEIIHVPADVSETDKFMNWVSDNCDRCELDEKKKSKIMVCAEEIFVNIASYAYPDELKRKEQDTVVRFKYIKPLGEITISITDSGVKYNPLEHEDPDVFAEADNRQAGGLGLLMVKSMMDSVEYEYKNGHNILWLKCYK